jgi:hypothetical protein
MPEEQDEEAVESHEAPRSERLGLPPPEVGGLSTELVEERTMERRAGIPGQCGLVVTEDGKKGDANSNSLPLLASAGRRC